MPSIEQKCRRNKHGCGVLGAWGETHVSASGWAAAALFRAVFLRGELHRLFPLCILADAPHSDVRVSRPTCSGLITVRFVLINIQV